MRSRLFTSLLSATIGRRRTRWSVGRAKTIQESQVCIREKNTHKPTLHTRTRGREHTSHPDARGALSTQSPRGMQGSRNQKKKKKKRCGHRRPSQMRRMGQVSLMEWPGVSDVAQFIFVPPQLIDTAAEALACASATTPTPHTHPRPRHSAAPAHPRPKSKKQQCKLT